MIRVIKVYRSCSKCGGIHKEGVSCNKGYNRVKYTTKAVGFRRTNAWKKKSIEIKKRDKYLCQVCLLDKVYTYKMLEVHHINSIDSNYNSKLDNDNLITLCVTCHKRADKNLIDKSMLEEIAKKNNEVIDCML